MAITSGNFGSLAGTSASMTLADQMVLTKGRSSGFDYLRLILALGIIGWHTQLISYGTDDSAWKPVLGPFALLMVPMFFALSGFLVAGSLERSETLFGFLGLRVLRIMPALSVEVVLSALFLGPLLTTYTLQGYFADEVFYLYLLNVVGPIHDYLPGVFQDHPNTQVSGQLWTVPYEMGCYVLLSILAVSGIIRRRYLLLGFIVAYYVAQVANTILRPSTGFQGAGGSSIVMAFFAGILFYQYRDRVVWSKLAFAACLALAIALPILIPKGIRLTAVPIAYLTIYLGLLNPPRNRVLLSGDYSYGLYVYGYSIQQAVYNLGPSFQNWYMNLLISVPVTASIAVLSWRYVEKPALNQRDKLKAMEGWYIRRFRGGAPVSSP